MLLNNMKISHKLLTIIVMGIIVVVAFSASNIFIGYQELSTLESIYNKNFEPLNNLRKMQLIFRELEYRMAGVASDLLPPIGSGVHLEDSIKKLDSMWNSTKGRIDEPGMADKLAEFDKGYALYKDFAKRLKVLYFDNDIDPILDMADEYYDYKPMIFKPLDAMALEKDRQVREIHDQRKSAINKINSSIVVVSLLTISIFILFGVLIVKSINTPIQTVMDAAERVGSGDLTSTVVLDSTDEMGRMVIVLNAMIENLRGAFGNIARDAGVVASHADKLSESSASLLSGADHQSRQLEQVATSSTEASQTILDMAKNASVASKAALESSETALKGNEIVDRAVISITTLADNVQIAAATIGRLDDSSQEIGEIVSVIQDIADQTNLLALNAAIEAARAGEQGRGFAVVADEVRKLAEKTSRSTTEIGERVQSIQKASGESISIMNSGKSLASEAVGAAREAGESLVNIVQGSSRVTEMIQRIGVAIEQQSAATEEINQSLEYVAGIINDSLRLMESVKDSAGDLSKLSNEVMGEVSRFKTA